MLTIGLTGGSGCGKTAFAASFAQPPIAILDADRIYHELTEGASPCTEALAAAFGEDILNENGSLCRSALASLVFGNTPAHEERLALLNSITHRFVRAAFEERIEALRAAGCPAVILDAPLLFEAGFECFCDAVIVVLADVSARLARIMERDGLDEEGARRRLDAQPPDTFYTDRADFVVYNDGNLDTLRKEAEGLRSYLFEQK